MGLHSDDATDVATCSNFREVVIKDYHFNWEISFEEKAVIGDAVLSFSTLKTTQIVNLDIYETLHPETIQLKKGNSAELESLQFEVQEFTAYGRKLHIQIPNGVEAGTDFSLQIKYKAKEGGPGICWLDPSQTAGKQKPYMYTQGQSVCNRAFFPCQDTPAIKSTYTANVKIPDGFNAVMSAGESNSKGDNTYFFKQTIPIQCYLVALAVGDIQSAKIGPRSHVWTEPSMLDKAKAEFDGVVEEFIATGEKLFGPYVWGRYDILVMPPSFPFGGMENPCLTFVTPCLLVGDKSLTDVIIHEISHSWFGNLVTNANWSEFWLNEGFTMFAQRRIMEKIFGRPYTCLETISGLALLRQHMDNGGEDHPLNKLRVLIEAGVDPDDTYNETPYEKGFCFVSYLQNLAGDPDKFDDFLKAYVAKYQFKSIVAEDLFDFFLEYFPDLAKENIDKKEGMEFHEIWLNKSGWPLYVPDMSPSQELTEPVEHLANVWIGTSTEELSKDISGWKTYQVLHFLDKILEAESVSADILSKFAAEYSHIPLSHNAEIRLRWSQICIKNHYDQELSNIRQYLQSQGKQKYTLPVYRTLVKGSEAAKSLASTVFDETKEQLHFQVRNYVAKIIGRPSTKT